MSVNLSETYTKEVVGYVASRDEEARERAYELGRAAISQGLGVLDLSRMHTLVLAAHPELAADGVHAWEFFSEVLAPFEMALRGFRDANASLKRFAQTLEERVSERTAELRATERQLRDQRNVLRSVLDSMSDGVVVADAAGHFQLVNPAGERIVGTEGSTTRPADWGRRFGVFLIDEKTPMDAKRIPLVRALGGEDVRDEEMFIRNERVPAGVHLRVSASPLRDEAGAADGGVVVFRDVTARRRAEEQARRAEERLVRAQKLDAIGQLAGGVAHDFNNLLAVISSYASLLLDDLPADDARAADVQQIAKASASAASLTRQLLAFSRQQVMQPSQLDLNEIVSDVSKMLKRTIGEHIELAVSLDPTLGPVRADRGQLEQVLMNLAVNARDAMPDGGKLTFETQNVVLDAEEGGSRGSLPPGAHVVLSVTDTGTGIDEATRARIFEPFFTTKGLGRGTGLGLATVYGIVQQTGGHIAVYSEVGQGTSFKVYLPRATGQGAQAIAGPVLVGARGTETVLLVEDDEAVRVVATRVLRNAGYQVLVARDAAEARTTSQTFTGVIHLLVTDVVMPGSPGPELAEELTRKRDAMRVLFTSGYAPGAMRHQGALPPGAFFLEKPFTAQSLRQKAREALGGGENG